MSSLLRPSFLHHLVEPSRALGIPQLSRREYLPGISSVAFSRPQSYHCSPHLAHRPRITSFHTSKTVITQSNLTKIDVHSISTSQSHKRHEAMERNLQPTPQNTPQLSNSILRTSKDSMGEQKWKNIETEALVLHEIGGNFNLEPVVLDEVRHDEILVEMSYSGICHTDIVMQQGLLPLLEYPAILGHEGAGTVLAIGKGVQDPKLRVGDSVLLSFNHCDDCGACSSTPAHPAFCHRLTPINFNSVRSDGSTPASLPNGTSVRSQFFGQSSFARRSVVNQKSVVRYPYGELGELGALYAPLGCGIQTGAGTVMNVLKPGPKDSIVVFGLGCVGLAALMAAVYRNASQIIAVDIVEAKLEMARELGATHTINSLEVRKEGKGIVDVIKEITEGGEGVTFAMDCTGIPGIIENCIDVLGPSGTAATVGVPPAGGKIQVDALSFMLGNKHFIGVIEGDSIPREFVPTLIQMHREGRFPVEKLCRTYPVARLQDALDDLHAGRVIKPVISWEKV